MELLLLLLIVLILGAFSVTATELGVDSRDVSDDHRRSPYPVGLS